MARKYFIWKDPACAGKDVEWIEVSGREFLQLTRRKENLNRRFVKLYPVVVDDDCYVMEATPAQYISWRKEHDAAKNCHTPSRAKKTQIQRVGPAEKQLLDGLETVAAKQKWVMGIGGKHSLDAPLVDGDIMTLLEAVSDGSVDVEEEVTQRVLLSQLSWALGQLSEGSLGIIVAYFWHRLTTAELGEILGVAQSTAHERLKKALDELRSFFF